MMRMTLTSPISGGVSGTWESTFSNAAANNGGQVSGGTTSSGTALFFTPRAPWACPDGRSDTSFAATLTLNFNRLTGNWTALNCHGGSLDLVKQYPPPIDTPVTFPETAATGSVIARAGDENLARRFADRTRVRTPLP